MIVFLLVVIIAILLFGAAAVLGVVGLVFGAAIAIAVMTYVGVTHHIHIEDDQALYGFEGLCLAVVAFAIYKVMQQGKAKQVKRQRLADQWAEMMKTRADDPDEAKRVIAKYPDFAENYEAWKVLGRKPLKQS